MYKMPAHMMTPALSLLLISFSIQDCYDISCAKLQGALVMPLMARGYSAGLIKFNLITGQKPSA